MGLHPLILSVIDKDETNYITSKLITNSSMDTITYTIISNTLDSVKREEILKSYNITKEMYEKIESKTIGNKTFKKIELPRLTEPVS